MNWKDPNEPGKPQSNPADISVSSAQPARTAAMSTQVGKPSFERLLYDPNHHTYFRIYGFKTGSLFYTWNSVMSVRFGGFFKGFLWIVLEYRRYNHATKKNPFPDAYTFLVLTLPLSTSAEPSERPHCDTISAAISAGAKGHQYDCRCWVTITWPCQGKELRIISSMLLQEFISWLISCSFFHPSKGQLIQSKETDCSSPRCRTASVHTLWQDLQILAATLLSQKKSEGNMGTSTSTSAAHGTYSWQQSLSWPWK